MSEYIVYVEGFHYPSHLCLYIALYRQLYNILKDGGCFSNRREPSLGQKGVLKQHGYLSLVPINVALMHAGTVNNSIRSGSHRNTLVCMHTFPFGPCVPVLTAHSFDWVVKCTGACKKVVQALLFKIALYQTMLLQDAFVVPLTFNCHLCVFRKGSARNMHR